ncbi:protein LONGIFOLIA 1-like [Durio zibethinus]|uniref:Protein LONGIFOLIA 1-like n=1 Tax=Durio zibethinus TaxID=66656 RepID=A0A6P5YCT4_DURZI|nr:protein LONGIFOLIA 1-like [Durio zibethinus]XP_022738284.1 protein LONGIFOLIA 1-like [Durio zibethinus]
MAAKLLHSLADDNPDLQKQIGCMTGIFQIFDRQHMLTTKRLSQRKLPAGNSHLNNGILEGDSKNAYHRHTTTEMNINRSVNEKQRISTESSRASFSSSCSSSLSSLDCNKTAPQEASSFDRILFPETRFRDPVMNQPSTSPRLGSQCLDIRDVVKDSMYREARGLLDKTTTREEVSGSTVKHRDSPRPFQLPKSANGSYGVGINGKKNVHADLKESLRVLAELRETPWYYNNEAREFRRSSHEANGLWNSISRDAPRFSYDGREINRLSFESRDTFKSTSKVKELPRLSLDSRERSMRGANYLTKSFHNSCNLNSRVTNPPQSPGAQKRPPNVVAKLMGLEPLPDSSSVGDAQLGVVKTCSVEDKNPFSQSLRANDLNWQTRASNSTRSSVKDPTSPRWKNPDLVMKPISSSRFPIEPAPWRHVDGSRGSQRQPLKHVKVPAETPYSFPSVYSEIENRLKDLEFKQSGKDLRALKQIIEAMQAKGLLETRKEEQTASLVTQRDYEPNCTSPSQNLRGQRSPQNTRITSSPTRGLDSIRTYESPIVIMKPAKLVEKVGIHASTVIPIDDFSSIPKIQIGVSVDNKQGSINSRAARDHTSRNGRSDSAASSTDKRVSSRNIRPIQSSTKPPKESTMNSVKNSGSVSPRLQQKKLELDRRSRPPTPPSDPSKPRRQSNQHSSESGSSGGKHRQKSQNMQQCDDQLSQISTESWTSSHQGDDISVQSDSNIILESKLNVEVTCHERTMEINDSQSPSMKAVKYSISGIMQKKSTSRLVEDGSEAELAVVAPEHPSPVSILDTSIYRDDAPSPVKQIMNTPEGYSAEGFNDDHNEEQWIPADKCLSSNVGSGLTSEINRKKLQNIEHLVQKLRRLNSNHDEASTDYIASLCENTNPDHRYISEILLASGLLLRDVGSGLTTFQLHPSGHPINPELFFVLEQTKASSLLSKEESNAGKVSHSKPDHEKFHRKLIFDSVNEILVRKLALVGAYPEPWIYSGKLAKKTLSAQKLLKELCLEIEQLQAKKSKSNLEEEEDGLKSILWEDVMCRSESWTDFNCEISGMVLDVERLVFKDLVDEIVIGEGGGLRAKQTRRRQLFSK